MGASSSRRYEPDIARRRGSSDASSCGSDSSVALHSGTFIDHNESTAVQDAAYAMTRGGQLLHQAVRRRASAETVAAVLKMHPSSSMCKDADGWLPLHWAAAMGELPVVLLLLPGCPAAAEVPSPAGNLPLHCAISGKAPLPLIAAVLKVFPAAVTARNDKGNLPLHLAIKSKAAAGVVALVAEATRRADAALAMAPDCEGFTPLHLVIAYKAPAADVAALLPPGAASAAAAAQEDAFGWVPLQMAVTHKAPADVVAVVLAACPAALAAVTPAGDTALHLAIKSRAPAAMVLALLAAFPAAAGLRDGYGNMPLVYASGEVAAALQRAGQAQPTRVETASAEPAATAAAAAAMNSRAGTAPPLLRAKTRVRLIVPSRRTAVVRK